MLWPTRMGCFLRSRSRIRSKRSLTPGSLAGKMLKLRTIPMLATGEVGDACWLISPVGTYNVMDPLGQDRLEPGLQISSESQNAAQFALGLGLFAAFCTQPPGRGQAF